MRVVIARTAPVLSMDMYADGLVRGLKAIRPEWDIVEVKPYYLNHNSNKSLIAKLWRYCQRSWYYPYTVTQQKADIFHVIDHSYGHLVYWLKQTGQPIIVTCHDLANFIYPENIYSDAKLPFISLLTWKFAVQGMKIADQVVAISSNTAKDIERMLNIQTTIIPNAIDSVFRPLLPNEVKHFRREQGILPDQICLLNVGSVVPRKNINTILKTLKVLKERGSDVHLWKTGADFNLDQKKLIRSQGLDNFITYLGQPDLQTLVQIYNAADVLLSPSLYEGFGMTVLEAMACGIPVITSNVSSLPEVAGDAGILVDPMDVQSIADAVHRLHSDPIYRQSLIDKGIARVKAFTWEATAEQIAKLYEKAAG